MHLFYRHHPSPASLQPEPPLHPPSSVGRRVPDQGEGTPGEDARLRQRARLQGGRDVPQGFHPWSPAQRECALTLGNRRPVRELDGPMVCVAGVKGEGGLGVLQDLHFGGALLN